MSKPEWKDAPDWENWLAQDADGSWWWFEDMPEPLSVGWCCTMPFQGNNKCARRANGNAGKWKETLERRP